MVILKDMNQDPKSKNKAFKTHFLKQYYMPW